ncbi:hypothetical protein [Litchfieldia alkalitelluris]|uniref:hypothetical protein n=1 Tax=Litchfieldia alkalitelluris TaxID=304268 RepID=UPI000998124F|nr:hypothetical protein [Litchfieldia alkalitelluris]
MNKGVSVYIEYSVKQADLLPYESTMKDVLDHLANYGAKNIQWFVSSKENHIYVEQFELPTVAHFYALKKLRTEGQHPLFKELRKYCDLEIRDISFWALKNCS